MRSAFVAAAFAAGAIAVPFQKRDIVTDYDVVYVTDVVTVTAGEKPLTVSSSPSPASATESTTTVTQAAHYGHHSYHWPSSSSSSSSSEVESVPAETSVIQSTWTSSSSEAAPTTTSTSVYVAPVSTYAAPTSYTPSSSSSSSADSTSASSSAPTSYEEITVYHHNLHRANHSAPDIAWDAGLASTAATIAASCKYAHDTTTNGGGYGQNIAAGIEPANISSIITDLFYNGEVNWFDGLYGAANPDMTNFEHWGHFSQIVWKDTTHVGCATQHCPGGLANTDPDVPPYFTVCNYENPGNFGGEYGANIGQSLNKATVDWSAGGIS